MCDENVSSVYSVFFYEFDASLLMLGESSLMYWKMWKTRINSATNMRMNSQGTS